MGFFFAAGLETLVLIALDGLINGCVVGLDYAVPWEGNRDIASSNVDSLSNLEYLKPTSVVPLRLVSPSLEVTMLTMAVWGENRDRNLDVHKRGLRRI